MINPLQTSAGVFRARAWAASKQDRLASDDLFISADTDEVRLLNNLNNHKQNINKQTR